MSETNEAVTPETSAIPTLETQITELQKDPNADRATLDGLLEKRAFAKWYETQPAGAIPNVNNFEDAFKSYKALQGHATKVSQENAELRKKLEAPAATPAPAAPAAPAVEIDQSTFPQITPAAPAPNDPASAPKTAGPFLTKDEYEEIRNEAISSGTISDEKREKLVAKGIPEEAISDMLEAGKARAALAWQKLIKMAGSPERVRDIFSWVATLDPKRIESINSALKGPNHEIIFRGLSAEFDQTVGTKAKEPPKIKNQVPTTSIPNAVQPYASIADYAKDRNDPRFVTDAAFQAAVFARANVTPFMNGSMFQRN